MKQNKTACAKEKRLPVIGITGGVGAGKSVVMGMLEKDFHAGVILADLVAHELMEPGAVSYEQIVQEFGSSVLAKDGTIDRDALSARVFGHPERLKKLNEITHPNVKKEILSRIERLQQKKKVRFIAVEAALLIEGGYAEMLDTLWYVYADEETRIKRLMDNRGYSEEKSRAIMKRQLNEDGFRQHCSVVIDNSQGVEELHEQLVEKIVSLREKDSVI